MVTSTRHGAGRECLDEEDAGGGQVAPGGQPHVDDLPVLVDGPVEVCPSSVDLDVGLVDEPAATRNVTACPCRHHELGCEPLDPPVDGDVVDRDATLGEQLVNVAVGQARTAGTTAPPARSPHEESGNQRTPRGKTRS